MRPFATTFGILLSFIAILAISVPASSEVFTDASGKYESNQPYNLNVVYFVPKDLEALPNSQKRLSVILLHAKSFLKKQMKQRGFPNAEMGLFVNSENVVKVTYLTGKLEHEKYAYAEPEGYGRATAEIEAFYAKNPLEKASEHVLVIMPTSIKADGEITWGPPFFGVGRYCFALDYVEMEQKTLGQAGVLGDIATPWIGGMIHELGHGLNIGHDMSLASEQETKGESLMSAGNSTYGSEPTQLTAASAAILNTCQVFQKTKTADIYEEAELKPAAINVKADNGNVLVTGSFASDKPVDSIIAFLDPSGREDYNRVGWVQRMADGKNTFSFTMPVKELENRAGNAELTLTAVFKNGSQTDFFNLPFTFKNQKPIIKKGK